MIPRRLNSSSTVLASHTIMLSVDFGISNFVAPSEDVSDGLSVLAELSVSAESEGDSFIVVSIACAAVKACKPDSF